MKRSISLLLMFFNLVLFSQENSMQVAVSEGNPISIENQKKGSDLWKLSHPAIQREVEGYMSKTSIQAGDSIALFVNTSASTFNYSIFRMGWYDGVGGRMIQERVTVSGHEQAVPKPDKQTGLVECNWILPNYIQTDTTWTTGVYLVKLEELTTHKQSYCIFILRDDKTRSDILFPLPVTTYQAYNYWGGKSLYSFGCGEALPWGSTSGDAASRVSFLRPYAISNNPIAAIGMGAGEFFTNVQPVQNGYPISSSAWNYSMVRWLEKEGYDVSYSTNIDTHVAGKNLLNHGMFLSQGHDEYWSKQMVKNLKDASKAGINLAFFGANNLYWQVRFEPSSATGALNSTMVCYKSDISDPLKDERTTVKFRNPPINSPESAFLGVQFKNEPVDKSMIISNADHRLFKNTGLKNGDELKGLLGYEVDGTTKFSPKNIEVLTSTLALKENYEGMPFTYKIKAFFASLKFNYLILLSILSMVIVVLLVKRLTKRSKSNFQRFLQTALVILFLIGNVSAYLVHDYFVNEFTTNMTIYTRPADGEKTSKIFSTGTIQWSWGLDDFNAPNLRTSRLDKRVQTITKNVFDELIQKKE